MRLFEPLMVLYLTGATSPQEIEKAANGGVVRAVKLYPAGATTNSEAGVSDLLGQCGAVLQDTNDIKPGDILETFDVEMRDRTL